jgi:hypothetical protein
MSTPAVLIARAKVREFPGFVSGDVILGEVAQPDRPGEQPGSNVNEVILTMPAFHPMFWLVAFHRKKRPRSGSRLPAPDFQALPLPSRSVRSGICCLGKEQFENDNDLL